MYIFWLAIFRNRSLCAVRRLRGFEAACKRCSFHIIREYWNYSTKTIWFEVILINWRKRSGKNQKAEKNKRNTLRAFASRAKKIHLFFFLAAIFRMRLLENDHCALFGGCAVLRLRGKRWCSFHIIREYWNYSTKTGRLWKSKLSPRIFPGEFFNTLHFNGH